MANGKRRTIVNSGDYWDFETNPLFKGHYVSECRAMVEDPKTKEKEEKVIGFFFDDEDGEEHIISNSFAIEKALNTELEDEQCLAKDSGLLFEIEFKGKTEIKNGKPFNRFNVSIIS